jgi:hypothetical protein
LDNINFASSKAAFDVFLDELLDIPYQLKKKKNIETKALSEFSVNQQYNQSPLRGFMIYLFITISFTYSLFFIEKNQSAKQESYMEEEFRILDSQEDSFWTELDTDLLSKLESTAQKENQPTFIEDTVPKTIPLPTSAFSGFTTASGKTLKPPSAEAIQKAMKLNLYEDNFSKAPATPLIDEFTIIPQNTKKDPDNIPKITGFTSASGKPIQAVSEKARQRAIAMFKELNEEPINSEPSPQEVKRVSNKRPFDASFNEAKYENVLKQYGGFQMAHNKKRITVSSDAKKQAISLFEVDSTVPQPLRDVGNLNKSIDSPIVPDITSKSLDKDTRKPTTIPALPKRNKRVSAIGGQTKPFKSPVVRSNIELTRAAAQNKNNMNKPKVEPVFDLTSK